MSFAHLKILKTNAIMKSRDVVRDTAIHEGGKVNTIKMHPLMMLLAGADDIDTLHLLNETTNKYMTKVSNVEILAKTASAIVRFNPRTRYQFYRKQKDE